jgi:hypothetical protein
MPRLCGRRTDALEFIWVAAHLAVSRRRIGRNGVPKMIRLGLTRDRLFDLTLERRLGNYRFARAPKQPGGAYVRRALDGARMLFGAVRKLIAAAGHHRIERELRIGGPRHDWLRIDDDHFTPIEH